MTTKNILNLANRIKLSKTYQPFRSTNVADHSNFPNNNVLQFRHYSSIKCKVMFFDLYIYLLIRKK